MPSEIIAATFISLSRFLGGIELSGLILLGIVGFYAYISRATIPTVFFAVYLIIAALYQTIGGIFFPLFGLANIAGAVFVFMGAKAQFSQA